MLLLSSEERRKSSNTSLSLLHRRWCVCTMPFVGGECCCSVCELLVLRNWCLMMSCREGCCCALKPLKPRVVAFFVFFWEILFVYLSFSSCLQRFCDSERKKPLKLCTHACFDDRA